MIIIAVNNPVINCCCRSHSYLRPGRKRGQKDLKKDSREPEARKDSKSSSTRGLANGERKQKTCNNFNVDEILKNGLATPCNSPDVREWYVAWGRSALRSSNPRNSAECAQMKACATDDIPTFGVVTHLRVYSIAAPFKTALSPISFNSTIILTPFHAGLQRKLRLLQSTHRWINVLSRSISVPVSS